MQTIFCVHRQMPYSSGSECVARHTNIYRDWTKNYPKDYPLWLCNSSYMVQSMKRRIGAGKWTLDKKGHTHLFTLHSGYAIHYCHAIPGELDTLQSMKVSYSKTGKPQLCSQCSVLITIAVSTYFTAIHTHTVMSHVRILLRELQQHLFTVPCRPFTFLVTSSATAVSMVIVQTVPLIVFVSLVVTGLLIQ